MAPLPTLFAAFFANLELCLLLELGGGVTSGIWCSIGAVLCTSSKGCGRGLEIDSMKLSMEGGCGWRPSIELFPDWPTVGTCRQNIVGSPPRGIPRW